MYLIDIKLLPYDRTPVDWAPCDGRLLTTRGYEPLHSKIGNIYGGDHSRFGLPDLRERVLIGSGKQYTAFIPGGENTHKLTIAEIPSHNHPAVASSNGTDAASPEGNCWPSDAGYMRTQNASMSAQSVGTQGDDQPHNNMSPCLALNYAICTRGIYFHSLSDIDDFYGAIRVFCVPVADTKKWVHCDGRLMSIGAHPDLYNVLGTRFGGDGQTTFALPNLIGRAAVSHGEAPGLTHYKTGETAGQETVTLTREQLPKHSHAAQAMLTADSQRPEKKVWASEAGKRPPVDSYASKLGTGATMNAVAIGETGGGKPHNNMMAYQSFNFMICIDGVKPY